MSIDDDSGYVDQELNGKVGQNYVQFYQHAVRNNFKSKEEGRDIFEDKDYILIISPGQNKTEVRRPVRPDDKDEYRAQWRAYKERREQPLSGTPIDHLPGITPSWREVLLYNNIRTIEQLAGLSDGNLKNIGMGGAELRDQATAYLEKNTVETSQLKRHAENLERQVADMQRQLNELLARPASVATERPKRAPAKRRKKKPVAKPKAKKEVADVASNDSSVGL